VQCLQPKIRIMKAELTIDTLLIQWYEEKQNQRIEKGFIKVDNLQDIYNDLNTGFDWCDRVISLKQYKLFQAIFAKETKHFPSDKEICFVEHNNRTIVASVSGTYNRGHISFKLK